MKALKHVQDGSFKGRNEHREVFIHELQERKDFLPASLLKELQNYIQGELVYIPKLEKKRAGWGENNGTRKLIEKRNREILQLHNSGASVTELIQRFHLSEDSIRKIIVKTRGKLKHAVK